MGGIKQLKARLSEYVPLAKAGETVLVTELWELSPATCDLACLLAPNKLLRTLDAEDAASSAA